MTVANAVRAARGNHRALDRQAIPLDLVSRTARINTKTTNVMNATDSDPIWSCHLGSLLDRWPNSSSRSSNVLSTVMNAQAPPNNATSSVFAVSLYSMLALFFRFAIKTPARRLASHLLIVKTGHSASAIRRKAPDVRISMLRCEVFRIPSTNKSMDRFLICSRI
jgi:hypothetical protein